MGAIGGALGALFHHLLHFVTQVRGENPWLVWLLPVGGLLSIGWYHLLKLKNNRGTNEIIEATLDGGELSPCIAPGIVGAAALTHLFGGSARREGAALQLGGSAASILAKAFRLPGEERQLMVMAGMSSVFAGLFVTPMTAAVFCMEFESVGTLLSPAVLPCYLAACMSARLSSMAKRFRLENPGILDCFKIALLYKQIGNNRYALSYCNRILNIDPNAYIGYACAADIYATAGHYNASVKIYDLLIDKAKNRAQYYADRAAYKKKCGDIEGYKSDLKKAKELSPMLNTDFSIIEDTLNPKQLSLTIM